MPTTPAAIATGSPESTYAGKRIAHLGGNAADIAVSAALTATVSEILFASLGGAAFVMCKMPGQSAELIDGGDAMPTLPRSSQETPRVGLRPRLPTGTASRSVAVTPPLGYPAHWPLWNSPGNAMAVCHGARLLRRPWNFHAVATQQARPWPHGLRCRARCFFFPNRQAEPVSSQTEKPQ